MHCILHKENIQYFIKYCELTSHIRVKWDLLCKIIKSEIRFSSFYNYVYSNSVRILLDTSPVNSVIDNSVSDT